MFRLAIKDMLVMPAIVIGVQTQILDSSEVVAAAMRGTGKASWRIFRYQDCLPTHCQPA
jgi:hypothetical protein